MQVYLVRHGETLYNRGHLHQSADIALSERGREQARAVAMAMRALPQPLILTSDMVRAKETADIISKILSLPAHEEPLFREMKRPSRLAGKAYYGFESLTIGFQLLIHAYYATWHYSDEENLRDIRTRVHAAFEHLETYADRYEHVVVVSHAVFIKLMLIQLKKKHISVFSYFLAILKLTQVGNASVTRLNYTKVNGKYTWTIELVNERGHLMQSASHKNQTDSHA